ncbi:MAG TPA: OmpA family protein [Cyclobacteriaceae bacterium]|nr:OmpA family protein [Cyclobacteriaceae bacterium]
MRLLAIFLWVVGLAVTCTPALAQTPANEYYVTIGVFGVHKNALRLTEKANKMGFNAHYAINPAKKLYYVYLLQATSKRQAFTFVIKLRAETEFKDAWVFIGHLGQDGMTLEIIESGQTTPVVQETPDAVKEEPVKEVPVVTEPVVEQKPKVDSVVVAPVAKKVAKGKFFNFRFLNAENGNEVRGEIHLAESDRATQYQAFKANEMVDVGAPRNQAGAWFITTVAPGYKVLETTINYKDPLPSSSGTGPDGEIIIPLTLQRAKRGDYIEFNNVSFYRNSVIMQPQFKDEIDGLAGLMKENLNYKVRIHAHCNGNESRDIITLGTSTKYFESDPANQKITGSAKELTELRAEAVRRYLVSEGIAVERIMTKGEGGKEMVYPQNSVYANYNDRVEIEVVRH